MPAFAHDTTIPRDYLYWYHDNNRAIRVGAWKLVADHKNAWELYDVAKDCGESHNLAAEMPDKLQGLAAEWQRHTEEFTREAWPNGPEGSAISVRNCW